MGRSRRCGGAKSRERGQQRRLIRRPFPDMVTLILLPGMDGTGLLFADFLTALGPHLKTLVVSFPTNSPLDYAELEAVASSFIPRDEPYVLLAESFSGPIGICIASTKPQNLKGLVLCCSFARTPRRFALRLLKLLGSTPLKILPDNILGRTLLGRSSNAQLLNSLRASLAKVSGDALMARIKAMSTVDVSTKLQEIRVPILYLRAKRDSLVLRSSFLHIARMAPHVKLVELDGPHLLLQAVPSEAGPIVRDFLNHMERSHNPGSIS
jgi:pimeloyl-[acyl-carrier protein] methyl ester esterase